MQQHIYAKLGENTKLSTQHALFKNTMNKYVGQPEQQGKALLAVIQQWGENARSILSHVYEDNSTFFHDPDLYGHKMPVGIFVRLIQNLKDDNEDSTIDTLLRKQIDSQDTVLHIAAITATTEEFSLLLNVTKRCAMDIIPGDIYYVAKVTNTYDIVKATNTALLAGIEEFIKKAYQDKGIDTNWLTSFDTIYQAIEDDHDDIVIDTVLNDTLAQQANLSDQAKKSILCLRHLSTGRTLIDLAAVRDKADVVTSLLARTQDLVPQYDEHTGIKTSFTTEALRAAIRHDNLGMVQQLINAIRIHNVEYAQRFICWVDHDGDSPFAYALAIGTVEMINLLLEPAVTYLKAMNFNRSAMQKCPFTLLKGNNNLDDTQVNHIMQKILSVIADDDNIKTDYFLGLLSDSLQTIVTEAPEQIVVIIAAAGKHANNLLTMGWDDNNRQCLAEYIIIYGTDELKQSAFRHIHFLNMFLGKLLRKALHQHDFSLIDNIITLAGDKLSDVLADQDKNGMNALSIALLYGNEDIINIILSKASYELLKKVMTDESLSICQERIELRHAVTLNSSLHHHQRVAVFKKLNPAFPDEDIFYVGAAGYRARDFYFKREAEQLCKFLADPLAKDKEEKIHERLEGLKNADRQRLLTETGSPLAPFASDDKWIVPLEPPEILENNMLLVGLLHCQDIPREMCFKLAVEISKPILAELTATEHTYRQKCDKPIPLTYYSLFASILAFANADLINFYLIALGSKINSHVQLDLAQPDYFPRLLEENHHITDVQRKTIKQRLFKHLDKITMPSDIEKVIQQPWCQVLQRYMTDVNLFTHLLYFILPEKNKQMNLYVRIRKAVIQQGDILAHHEIFKILLSACGYSSLEILRNAYLNTFMGEANNRPNTGSDFYAPHLKQYLDTLRSLIREWETAYHTNDTTKCATLIHKAQVNGLVNHAFQDFVADHAEALKPLSRFRFFRQISGNRLVVAIRENKSMLVYQMLYAMAENRRYTILNTTFYQYPNQRLKPLDIALQYANTDMVFSIGKIQQLIGNGDQLQTKSTEQIAYLTKDNQQHGEEIRQRFIEMQQQVTEIKLQTDEVINMQKSPPDRASCNNTLKSIFAKVKENIDSKQIPEEMQHNASKSI